MPCRVVENGTFDAFWDTISFGFNGLVFFFAGASATNFAWRSTQVCSDHDLFPPLKLNLEWFFCSFRYIQCQHRTCASADVLAPS